MTIADLLPGEGTTLQLFVGQPASPGAVALLGPANESLTGGSGIQTEEVEYNPAYWFAYGDAPNGPIFGFNDGAGINQNNSTDGETFPFRDQAISIIAPFMPHQDLSGVTIPDDVKCTEFRLITDVLSLNSQLGNDYIGVVDMLAGSAPWQGLQGPQSFLRHPIPNSGNSPTGVRMFLPNNDVGIDNDAALRSIAELAAADQLGAVYSTRAGFSGTEYVTASITFVRDQAPIEPEPSFSIAGELKSTTRSFV